MILAVRVGEFNPNVADSDAVRDVARTAAQQLAAQRLDGHSRQLTSASCGTLNVARDLTTLTQQHTPELLVLDCDSSITDSRILLQMGIVLAQLRGHEAGQRLSVVLVAFENLPLLDDGVVNDVIESAETSDVELFHLWNNDVRLIRSHGGSDQPVLTIAMSEQRIAIPGQAAPTLTLSDLRPVLGHFCIHTLDSTLHSNLVLADGRPSSGIASSFVAQMPIAAVTEPIAIVGEAQELLKGLALSAVSHDSRRVLELGSPRSLAVDSHPAFILADVVTSQTQIESIRRHSDQRRWPAETPIVALAGSVHLPGLSHYLVELSDVATCTSEWDCSYCAVNVPLDSNPARMTPELHPAIFWDLCGWSEDQIDIGHWPSTSTANHYNLRIDTKALFERFAYSLSLRMRSLLRDAGIMPAWVDGIICTDGAESEYLAGELAARMRVSPDLILSLPSDVRAETVKHPSGSALEDWIASLDNREEWISRVRGVVLLDQAAHHFNTLAVFQRVALSLHCSPLAFTVFVDRTEVSGDKLTELADTHYLPLYRWPCPAVRSNLCTCRR